MATTVKSSTHTGLHLTKSSQNPVTVLTGVTVGTAGNYAIDGTGKIVWTITNDGSLSAAQSGILLNHGGTVTNGSSVFTGAHITGRYGVVIQGGAGDVNNSGSISGSATYSFAIGGNYKTAASGVGVQLLGGGTVTNGSSTAAKALISGATAGVQISGGAGQVLNDGTIVGRSSYSGYQSGSSLAYSGYNGTGVLLASGTVINGAVSVTSAVIQGGTTGVEIGTVGGSVINYGTITGSGEAKANYTLHNNGYFDQIGDGIALAGGNVTNGSVSDTKATISGGEFGILAGGNATTVLNDGTITSDGHFGSYLRYGGQGSYYHGAAVALLGAGQVTNGANGVVTALISGHDFGVEIAGESGSVANYGTIQGYYRTHTKYSTLYFKAFGTGVGLSAGGSVTNGSATDTAALIKGGVAGVAINGGAGQVINDGTITAAGAYYAYGSFSPRGTGVELGGGGRVVNGASGLTTAAIDGNVSGISVYGGTGTVSNYGTIAGSGSKTVSGRYSLAGTGVLLGAGGTVLNGSTSSTAAHVVGASVGVSVAGGAGYVSNFGTISAIATHNYYYPENGGTGVDLMSGGTVVNGSSNVTSATIVGGSFGVRLGNGGLVVNDGTIIGLGNSYYNNTVTASTGTAVVLAFGGTVLNGASAGSKALISGGAYGVYLAGGSASITNDGAITANIGVGDASGATAITLVNAGTVTGTGGIAALFLGGNDTVILQAGGVFNGAVIANATGSNTLELAAGVEASLGGLGSAFQNFQTLDVASGARLSLTGGNTAQNLLLSEDFGASVTVTGALSITSGNLNLSSAGTLAVGSGGAIQIGSGFALSGSMVVNSGATFIGNGVVTAPIVDQGTVATNGGTLTLNGGVSGSGVIAISEATLVAGSGLTNASIAFGPIGFGHLLLDKPQSVSALISGFQQTDLINLVGLSATSSSFNTVTDQLTLKGAGGTLGVLHFSSNYGSSLHVTGDGHGGTNIFLM